MHATANSFGGEDGAKRQAASQWLSDRDYIRQHIVVLVGKVASGAPEAALNLVEHEQCAALFGQVRGKVKKFPIDRTNPAFSLNSLDAHGTNAGIKFSSQVVQVIELDESDARHERNERSSIFRLTGGGQRAESAPMKRIFHGKNARLHLGFAAVAVLIVRLREGAGELERSLPSLGAAVAKESAVESGDFGQPLREFRLILVEEQI